MSPTASAIAQQLGGNKFLAMTGAKLTYDADNLIVKLPRAGKNRIKAMVVSVNSSDLYHVVFYRNEHGGDHWVVPEGGVYEDIGCDELARLFEDVTGFATSL